MPIEIKELHIRVAVQGSSGGQAAGGRAVSHGAAGGGRKSDGEWDALVAECVEQVLQILSNRMER